MYEGKTFLECVKLFGKQHGVPRAIIDRRIKALRESPHSHHYKAVVDSVSEATDADLRKLPGVECPALIVRMGSLVPRFVYLVPYKENGVPAVDLRVSMPGEVQGLKFRGRGRDPIRPLADDGGRGLHIADNDE